MMTKGTVRIFHISDILIYYSLNIIDVYKACEELEANGCSFQKKPNEGRMKGLAFVLDPDGYWIEVISRKPHSPINKKFTFAQTMLRIKDPVKTLNFYVNILGMKLLRQLDFDGAGFSLYFLAYVPPELEEASETDPDFISNELFNPILELTHNHGEYLVDYMYELIIVYYLYTSVSSLHSSFMY